MKVQWLEPEALNGTDAALWDIERNPALRTTVVTVLTLDRHVAPNRLTGVLDDVTRLVPRLRQRVEEPVLGLGVPHWVLADDFDVRDHLTIVEPDGVGFDCVLDVAVECAMTPFDRTRPLWECVYVDGWDGRRSAVVLKVHHALVDGVGGVALLDALLDAQRRAPERHHDTLPEYRRAHSGGGVHAPSLDAVGDASSATSRFVVDAVTHPFRAATSIIDATTSAARLLAPTGKVLSPLFIRRGPGRRLGVHEADLRRLHDGASRHGCTVNDLFVAAVVEGTSQFHRERSTPLDALRITMPVNTRTDDSPTAGNQWVPVRFRVPTDIDDPIERMAVIHAITNRSRAEPAMGFSHSLAGAIQMLPSALSSAVVAEMMHGVDLVITNVPGLHEERYLAGARVERIYPFAPTAGAAFNVALLSHRGTACFGMVSDTNAVDDADVLHASIAEAIDSTISATESTEPVPTRHVEPAATDDSPVRLSALDVGFLQLETASTPMHLGGIFVLEGAALRDDEGNLRLDDIRNHVESRLARAPAYLRRLHDVPLGVHRPLWVDAADFDIAHHVRSMSLTECVPHGGGVGGGLDHAVALCADLNAECLERTLPLWELWLIDGMNDGRVVMLQKVHHALTDGVGSVELATALFDFGPHIEPAPPAAHTITPPPSELRILTDASVEHLRDPVELVRTSVKAVVRTPSDMLRRVGSITTGLRGLLGPHTVAPASSLNQPVGPLRKIVSIEMEFDDINEIRTEHGGSANDVALTVIAGGLRAWLASRNEDLPELHAMCPVSQRDPDAAVGDGGNHVGAMLIALPLAEPDPFRRLAIIRERTGRAKARHDGDGVSWALDAFDHLPTIAGPMLRQIVAHQPFANLVITNVPGPPVPMWFLGARVTSVIPVVPLGPNTALGIALFSYDGTLSIGLHADPERCADLHILSDTVTDEVAALCRAERRLR